MRKILVILLVILSFTGCSRMYFKAGMEWIMEVEGTHLPAPTHSTEYVTIEECMDNNTPVLGMYVCSKPSARGKELGLFIKTEGKKVYFKFPESNIPDWYLMYDFSLKPGTGAYIYHPYMYSQDTAPMKTYIKCVSTRKSENGEWEIMNLEEYYEEDDIRSSPSGTGEWIKGLSSTRGILCNNKFNVDGMSSRLVQASLDGKVVYEEAAAGVAGPEAAGTFQVKVAGLDVYVSGIEKADVAYLYTDDGVICGRYELSPGQTTRILLPGTGVYVLKGNTGYAKIAAL